VKTASEMTYTVSGGSLNSTWSNPFKWTWVELDGTVVWCCGSTLTRRTMPTGRGTCVDSLCWVQFRSQAGSWCAPSVTRTMPPSCTRRFRKSVEEWECQLTSRSC